MPCFTVREISLDLTGADEGVLTRALEALGYTVQVNERTRAITATRVRDRYYTDTMTIAKGKATVQEGQEELVAEVNRGYSQEAIKTAGRKYGWTFKEDKQDQFHFTGLRRF